VLLACSVVDEDHKNRSRTKMPILLIAGHMQFAGLRERQELNVLYETGLDILGNSESFSASAWAIVGIQI
jgi:hypothetical protein